MKEGAFLIFLITVCSFTFIDEKTDETSYLVNGRITQSTSHCGGAQLPREEYIKYQASYPYSGLVLYLKKGEKNTLLNPVVDSVVTNSNGEFSINLPEGKYMLLTKNQLDTSVFERYNDPLSFVYGDSLCMRNWWEKGFYAFEIKQQDIDSIYLHFHKRCFIPEHIPCLSYNGPHPP